MSGHETRRERAEVYCAGCGIARAENPAHAPGSEECKRERLRRRRLARRRRECFTSYGDPKKQHDQTSAAAAVAAAAEHGVKVRPYRCRWCGHLHVGRAPGQ